MESVLKLEDLTLEIGGVAVVDGVSLSVGRGEVVALVGESGCGKSLTAMSVLGLLPSAVSVTRGRIGFEGADLASLPDESMRALRGRRLSIIFQEPGASLDPLTTVGSQIAGAITIHEKVNIDTAMSRACDMLATVGIADPERCLHQYPFELSGGMCQRVMIAIALICGPALLVADEPTTALDVTIQAQILSLMKNVVANHGTSILLITHDMGVVADIADRVAVMYAGRIAEIGPVGAIFRNPHHPYTAMLLASVPRLDVVPKSVLPTIEGTVPSAADLPDGCRFADRCPLADARCRREQPPVAEISDLHRVACWHAGDVPARFASRT